MSTTRIQLALNVEDVTAATAFYQNLFGVSPHKVRDGYANFAIEDPPLKLVLIEKPGASERLNHLGIEAANADHVATAVQRFHAAGLETRVAEHDVCCHAAQDKVFVTAPDVPLGWWEFYAVTDDNPANPDAATTSVCEANCAAQDNADSTCCASFGSTQIAGHEFAGVLDDGTAPSRSRAPSAAASASRAPTTCALRDRRRPGWLVQAG